MQNELCLDLEDVVKTFSTGRSSRWRRSKLRTFVTAVDHITLSVRRKETLVLLGESGSGKTTLGRLIVGLDPLDSGKITLNGVTVKYVREKGAQRGQLQMVFQDPGASIDPFMKVLSCVSEPLRKMGLSKNERTSRAYEAMNLVGLEQSIASRRASELSGGQKQRVAIARAIVSNPSVVVLDEPTSSIDVSIQAQILNLLVDLQANKGFTYVLITHDPKVEKYMADYIAVMYLGKVVEYGRASDLLSSPKHPYTQVLLSSGPKMGENKLPAVAPGEPGSLINLPLGCRFEPRCRFAMEKCKVHDPELSAINEKVKVACYLYSS